MDSYVNDCVGCETCRHLSDKEKLRLMNFEEKRT